MQFQRTYFLTFAKAGTSSIDHIAHSYFMVRGKTKREKQCYLHFFDSWRNYFSWKLKEENLQFLKNPVQ